MFVSCGTHTGLPHSHTAAKTSEEARAYAAEGNHGAAGSLEIQAQLLHQAVQADPPPKPGEAQLIGGLDAATVQDEVTAYGAAGDLGPQGTPEAQAKLLEEARAASPKPSEEAGASAAKPSPKKPCLRKDIKKVKGKAQIFTMSAAYAAAGNHFVVTIKGTYRYTCTYTYSYKCTYAYTGKHMVVTITDASGETVQYLLTADGIIKKLGAAGYTPKYFQYKEVRSQTRNTHNDAPVIRNLSF